jgi:glutamate-1-semialdehyde 2,1-aminomutase
LLCGHGDGLLVKAGSGVAALGLPDSPGVPLMAKLTLTCPFNDLANGIHVRAIWEADRRRDSRTGGRNVVLALDFRRIAQCDDTLGALLIFDEVMTGFRIAMAAHRSDMACGLISLWAK